jgi:hypothetical protein
MNISLEQDIRIRNLEINPTIIFIRFAIISASKVHNTANHFLHNGTTTLYDALTPLAWSQIFNIALTYYCKSTYKYVESSVTQHHQPCPQSK